MRISLRRLLFVTVLLAAALGASATPQHITVNVDSILAALRSDPTDSLPVVVDRNFMPTPASAYGPAVFGQYIFLDTLRADKPSPHFTSMFPSATSWLEDELFRQNLINSVKQGYMLEHPEAVLYNMANLPEPPPLYRPMVDPKQHKFAIKAIASTDAASVVDAKVDFKRQNWINTFEGALQFSESYLSPNWYQGGTGNLNAIANVIWTNKLNQAFHPNLMFETTVQYKLAMNNAPDDSLHTYNISEDLFRITSKFGVKAFKRWFYSVNLQFKTQFFNSYKKNTTDLVSAFFSPAELNMGLGMTYNYTNAKKTVTFDASISPLAWNLKMCPNKNIDPTTVGIESGRVANQIGFNTECKFKWNISGNISYQSRFFMFTDYSYIQGDWENTFQFAFNRFLSTQLFVHLRYDSSTKPAVNNGWKYWQLKEILSIGFSYKFDTGA